MTTMTQEAPENKHPYLRPLLLLSSWLSSVLILNSCHKVPLRDQRGNFSLAAAHWFENEKTQYVFFSLDNLRKEHTAADFTSRFEIALEGLTDDAYQPLDPARAVHIHSVVPCGENRLCGSYSLHAERAASAVRVRFRYYQGSPVTVELRIPNTLHPESDSADAQSAFVYGVFNGDNSRAQWRVHDNFGSPNSEEIKSFGMIRSFETSDPHLATVEPRAQVELRQRSGSPFLFPATAVCVGSNLPPISAHISAHRFSGIESWLPETFAPNAPEGTLCSRVRFLDHRGETLRTAFALARRNPVLLDETLSVQAPLHPARRIPLVISYCPGLPDSDALTSSIFLDYQRFILGLGKAPIDVCFKAGDEESFQRDLDRVITTKLAEARRTNTDDSDFMFIVAINHRLGPLVPRFHQHLLNALQTRVEAERSLISPRLAGAFVYDSTPQEYFANLNPGPGIVWCPRKPPDPSEGTPGSNNNNNDNNNNKGNNTDPLAQEPNCSSGAGGEWNLDVVNFVIPMGPFPTLETYVNHVRKMGDKGTSRNPEFVMNTVRTNPGSMTVQGLTVTFFDGERIPLTAGEGIHVCDDRDTDNILSSVMVHAPETEGNWVRPITSAVATLANPGEAISFAIGLAWEQPFWGGVSFDSPYSGKALSFIPFSMTVRNQQKLGDPKWQRGRWNIGRLLQKCVRHCDHPQFDEAGIYQIRGTWRTEYANRRCSTPRPPEPAKPAIGENP